MKSRIFISIVGLVLFQFGFAQDKKEYKIWNPAMDSIKVL